MRSYLFVFFLLALAFSSCTPVEKNKAQDLSQSQKSSQIMNGSVVTSENAPFNSVVGLYDSEFEFTCTGTLIASSTILTAAHCVENKGQGLYVVFSRHLIDTVKKTQDLKSNPYIRKVTLAVAHPDYKSEHDPDDEFGWSDLAVAQFEGDLPVNYTAIKMDKDQPKVKEMVLLSGFGVSDVQINGFNGLHVPNIDDLLANGEAVCMDDSKITCAMIKMSGDGPLRSAYAPVASLEGFEFVNNETKSGTCSGDSGGPAFRKTDMGYVLTGVTSRGSLACNQDGVYTIVSKYQKWISSKLK